MRSKYSVLVDVGDLGADEFCPGESEQRRAALIAVDKLKIDNLPVLSVSSVSSVYCAQQIKTLHAAFRCKPICLGFHSLAVLPECQARDEISSSTSKEKQQQGRQISKLPVSCPVARKVGEVLVARNPRHCRQWKPRDVPGRHETRQAIAEPCAFQQGAPGHGDRQSWQLCKGTACSGYGFIASPGRAQGPVLADQCDQSLVANVGNLGK